jgi:hypothetical protein
MVRPDMWNPWSWACELELQLQAYSLARMYLSGFQYIRVTTSKNQTGQQFISMRQEELGSDADSHLYLSSKSRQDMLLEM